MLHVNFVFHLPLSHYRNSFPFLACPSDGLRSLSLSPSYANLGKCSILYSPAQRAEIVEIFENKPETLEELKNIETEIRNIDANMLINVFRSFESRMRIFSDKHSDYIEYKVCLLLQFFLF